MSDIFGNKRDPHVTLALTSFDPYLFLARVNETINRVRQLKG